MGVTRESGSHDFQPKILSNLTMAVVLSGLKSAAELQVPQPPWTWTQSPGSRVDLDCESLRPMGLEPDFRNREEP